MDDDGEEIEGLNSGFGGVGYMENEMYDKYANNDIDGTYAGRDIDGHSSNVENKQIED